MSNRIATQQLDAAISELRLYLAHELVSAFNGKEHFDAMRDWSTVTTCIRRIRSNDHVLTETQKQNMDSAIQNLDSGLNLIVAILRTAISDRSRIGRDGSDIVQLIDEAVKRVNVEFEEAVRRHHAMTDTVLSSFVNYGSVHMGDKFSDISNSSIVSRSKVENAFNALKDSGNEEAANLINEISKVVAASNNHAAGIVFSKMTEEAVKPAPDKGMVKSCWDGLVAILPSVASMSSSVLKAFGLN